MGTIIINGHRYLFMLAVARQYQQTATITSTLYKADEQKFCLNKNKFWNSLKSHNIFVCV